MPERVREDLTGKKFGRLVVIAPDTANYLHQARWRCLCECGTEITARADNLKSGNTKSCGCLNSDKRSLRMEQLNSTHSQSNTRTYSIWKSMLKRCTNPNSSNWSGYGGRGISVCERWLIFENFFEDMGALPEGASIERIDVNGDYCLENCVWLDQKKQNSNKRNTVLIEWNNQKKTMAEWAKELGIPKSTLCTRLKRGWPLEKVFRR